MPLDVLSASQLKHSLYLLPTTNVTRRNGTSPAYHVLHLHRRQSLIRDTHVVEGSTDSQDTEVSAHVKAISRIGCVQDKVELELVGFMPVFFFGADKTLSSELFGISALVGGVGDGINSCAHRFCEDYTEVA